MDSRSQVSVDTFTSSFTWYIHGMILYVSVNFRTHKWERTCHTCLSEIDVVCLIWPSPFAPIFLTANLISSWLKNFCLYIHRNLFILSADGHVGRSHSLAMMSSTAVSIDVQVSLWGIDLESSRNAMAGLAVSFAFSFLRNLHRNYHNGWTE